MCYFVMEIKRLSLDNHLDICFHQAFFFLFINAISERGQRKEAYESIFDIRVYCFDAYDPKCQALSCKR